ncbi:Sodium-coupled monocarboxylate transporter 1 [Nibea albiflora]|uniref:Sodium-coupled monocarboxylate transporter 1 n=1 Tax=Nibea albiflora TaxID=240163 RepID=A0ACB7EZM3_NIBAL|nr:Sodium-coupled monocarboxylate transporter 1 [Nibea albiflora]
MVGTGGPVATFSVWDYVVFAGTILASACIGLFQAIRGRKETSSNEFLLGGRQMTAVPVAMSLTASFMSGITVIGTPTEAYRFGAAFWLFGFSYAIMSAITAEIFVPLFYRLGITSAYEYLGLRFSPHIRIIGTSMYIVQTALYTGLVIYAPALALNQNPLKRHTFWTITIGGSVMWTSIYAINQSQVQRYISCKTLGHAKMSLYVNMVGLWVTVSLAVFSGLTMFSIYKNCDPLANGDISTPDQTVLQENVYCGHERVNSEHNMFVHQLLPYLVMDILADYPGIPGLFVAAAYSGTLSTVSSSINALVAVTMEDFVLPVCKNLTPKQVTWMNMGLSVFFGALCIGMAGVASLMESILQAALSIFGMISGPLLGLYLLGMLFRTSNSTGGLAGMIIGLVLTLWVGIGGQIYPPTAEKTNPLPLTTVGCNSTMGQNYTTTISPVTLTSQPAVRPPLADSWYSLSYVYFALLGTLTTVVSGLLVSMMTGETLFPMSNSLISIYHKTVMGVRICFLSGGCKQETRNADLFVKRSDLICFSWCSKSEASDVTEKDASHFHMEADNPAFTESDETSKHAEKVTKL